MKRWSALGTFGVLSVCLFATPIHAQTIETTAKSAAVTRYDITKEETLTGTVSSVVEKATPELKMLGGSHLVVEIDLGKKIDASLGAFAMRGKSALSVTPGQRVQLTGMMKTIRGQQVFVTRLVLANGRVYLIRNEHGFIITQASRGATAKSGAKGGQL